MRQLLMLALGSGLIGALVGYSKERLRSGFWLGFAFGPMGWLVTWFFPRLAGRCHGCGRFLLQEMRACPKCGAVVAEPRYHVEKSDPS